MSSSPRSGSTWLGNVLKAIPGSSVLFEPLHLRHVPQAAKAGFSWRTYCPPNDKWQAGYDYLQAVFSGRVINEWTSREMSVREAQRTNVLVVKFVRANRLLPWICNNFNLRATVFLIRHPCAVIASQLKSSDWSSTKRPGIPAFLNDLPQFRSVIANTRDTEEYMAAVWALDQLPVLMQPHPHPWLIITYEELFLRPRETIDKIRSICNLPIDTEEAMVRIGQSSSVTYKSGISGISGWQKQLSPEQISRIIDTVHSLGLTFYTEQLEPDYDLLNSADLPEIIHRAGRDAAGKTALRRSRRERDEADTAENQSAKPAERQEEFRIIDGSVIPSPDRRWCGPELKDDAFYIRSAEKEALRLIDNFHLDKESRVLDIGCGQGRLPIGILRRLGEVRYLGIDIDERSIEWCRRYIEGEHPSFKFMHLDLYNERYNPDGTRIDNNFRFDQPAGSVDIIYLFSVFSHTTEKDMRVYLKEFARLLDDGGRLFFTTFVEEDVPDITINPEDYRLQCSGPLHIVRYNRDYLFSILRDSGYSIVKFTMPRNLTGKVRCTCIRWSNCVSLTSMFISNLTPAYERILRF